MFRFIHTADIHLDSPLRSLALKDRESAEAVAIATRQSFQAIIQLCLDEQVDALLIVGDLYDGALRSMKSAAFVVSQLRRLSHAGIRTFLVRGNHDAESRITRHLELPDGVHVFSAAGEAITLEDKDVVIHGVSFANPSMPKSLLPNFPPPVQGKINIGLLHTSLDGSPDHDVYAPCSLGELLDHGFDYWALGHIHKREVHAEGPRAVVMPGIPQGRHINEAGRKSVTLVEIDSPGKIRIDERETGIVRFERVAVDLSTATERGALRTRSEAALRDLRASVGSGHVIARVNLFGETELAPWLRRDADLVLEEIRDAGAYVGEVLIESVVNQTQIVPLDSDQPTGDPISELRLLMHDGQIDRTVLANRTADLLDALQKRLPPVLRDKFEGGEDGALIKKYMEEGSEDVLSRLTLPGNGGTGATGETQD